MSIRVAVESIPPLLLAAIRFLGAGIPLYAIGRHQSAERPTICQWKWATLIGFLFFVTGNAVVVWAEKRVTSGMAAILISTVPLWMVCLPALHSREQRPSRQTLVGVLMGLIGVAMLMNPFAEAIEHRTMGVNFALLGAALSWSLGTLVAAGAPLPRQTALSAGMEMIAGGLILLVISTLTGDWSVLDRSPVPMLVWGHLAYLITFGSLVGFSAYQWLTTHISRRLLSTYAYVNPLVALVLGCGFLQERLTAMMAIGAAVILSGVIVISLSKRDRIVS